MADAEHHRILWLQNIVDERVRNAIHVAMSITIASVQSMRHIQSRLMITFVDLKAEVARRIQLEDLWRNA